MIYLDHAATAPILPCVLDAMFPWLRSKNVGNANSTHTQGLNARKAIENARCQVARLINANPEEIFFTHGGTDSNMQWRSCMKSFRNYVVPYSEHKSLLDSLIDTVCFHVRVNSDGIVKTDDLSKILNIIGRGQKIVSVMWVNNEVGSINPMKEIAEICKENNALLHTDAVQAVGHVPVDVKDVKVDYLSMSGHKFGAPVGVGALYVSRSAPNYKDFSDSKGTPNLPGIVGLGAAANYVYEKLYDVNVEPIWWKMRELFIDELCKKLPGRVKINGGSQVSPNIISITIPGVNGEALMMYLDKEDIYISTGAACSSKDKTPSHVLTAMGMSDQDAKSTVRISFGYDNNRCDLFSTASEIAEGVRLLSK